ncbi:RagB/SusD family nutrient uptake outer membrane protein [Sunxiuqinia sp. A32]|uniref:RagB/SusD family nutrient uptake outer membrane protein n=1 Tax=Sunxiuqinia sp. A32 TaxID=3461496 RepID=UPI004045E60C
MNQSVVKYKFLICLSVLIIALYGCDDYLDEIPDDRLTIEEVFQKKNTSEEYLANIYNYIRDESDQWNGNPWTGSVDEVDVAWAKHDIYQITIGNWNATSAPFTFWSHFYNGIRSATYFINHIDANDELLRVGGQHLVDQYKAEARFLRAYFYFMLMRQYGPVVLIGNDILAADIPVADLMLPRSSFNECVDYVVGQLDSAAVQLPIVPAQDQDYGRATKGAALAIKSRLLLYAASPLYNGNSSLSSFRNLENEPLISLFYDREKWKRAADAAKEVIDLDVYQLYKDPGGDLIKTQRDILLTPWNQECIFARKSNNQAAWDVHCSIRRAGGWSGVGATQEMVDAYFMKDGKSIYESPLYSESGFTNNISNMYVDREPRFYASIIYNGQKYKGGSIVSDSVTVDFTYSGVDGKQVGGEDYTHTGYLVYKNVSSETNRLAGQYKSRPLVLIRLGEVYLNYAEALAEYGGSAAETEALSYLNLIRERAGIPQYGVGVGALPVVSGAELIEKIRMERRVELAFETHRWFDMRRWKVAKENMGEMHGMRIDKNGEEFYQRVVASTHVWKDEYYWWPIPQYEMDRANLIVQNPGW